MNNEHSFQLALDGVRVVQLPGVLCGHPRLAPNGPRPGEPLDFLRNILGRVGESGPDLPLHVLLPEQDWRLDGKHQVLREELDVHVDGHIQACHRLGEISVGDIA